MAAIDQPSGTGLAKPVRLRRLDLRTQYEDQAPETA